MEMESTQYSDGDIVWVKLGPKWWPGEVKDTNNLPSEVADFKKTPLLVVKFFDEDSYEYVKSWSNVYPYNCERKHGFIKKGMASFRNNVPMMQKFPKDITTAEEKTGGNVNILSEAEFLPEKKINYVEEVFGTPSPKKALKSDFKKKNRLSMKKDNTPYITHRRFLGYDDYEAQICIQHPGKDVMDEGERSEIERINQDDLSQEFVCLKCSYHTRRVELIIIHTKFHIQGVYKSSSKINKQRLKNRKNKLNITKKSDINRNTNSLKRKVKPLKSTPSKQPKLDADITKGDVHNTSATSEFETSIAEQKKDISIALLAEWEDDSDDEIPLFSTDKNSETIHTESFESAENIPSDTVKEVPETNGTNKSEIEKSIKSCFDFDEEDDEIDSGTSLVMRRSSLPDRNKILSSIDDEIREKAKNDDDAFEDTEEKSFMELMEETAVPKLPEISNTLKCEQNFHYAETIKFPDKVKPRDSTESIKEPTIFKYKHKRRMKEKEELESSKKVLKLETPLDNEIKNVEENSRELRKPGSNKSDKQEKKENTLSIDDKLVGHGLSKEYISIDATTGSLEIQTHKKEDIGKEVQGEKLTVSQENEAIDTDSANQNVSAESAIEKLKDETPKKEFTKSEKQKKMRSSCVSNEVIATDSATVRKEGTTKTLNDEIATAIKQLTTLERSRKKKSSVGTSVIDKYLSSLQDEMPKDMEKQKKERTSVSDDNNLVSKETPKRQKTRKTNEEIDDLSNKHVPGESLQNEIPTPKKEIEKQKKGKPSVSEEENTISSKNVPIEVVIENLQVEIPTSKKQTDEVKKGKSCVSEDVIDNAVSSENISVEVAVENLHVEIPTSKKQINRKETHKKTRSSYVAGDVVADDFSSKPASSEVAENEIPTPKKQTEKQKKETSTVANEVTDSVSSKLISEVTTEKLEDKTPKKQRLEKQKKTRSSYVGNEVIENELFDMHIPEEVKIDNLKEEMPTPKKQTEKQERKKSSVASEVIDGGSSKHILEKVTTVGTSTPKKQTKENEKHRKTRASYMTHEEVIDTEVSQKHVPAESLLTKRNRKSSTKEVTDNSTSNKHVPIEVTKESLEYEVPPTHKKRIDQQKKKKSTVASEVSDNAVSSKNVTKESLPYEIPTPKKQMDNQKKRKSSAISEVADNAASSKHAPIEVTKESLPDEIATPEKQMDKQKKRKSSVACDVTDNASSSHHASIEVAKESLPDKISTHKKKLDKLKKRKPSATSDVTDDALSNKHVSIEVTKVSLSNEIPTPKKQVDKLKKIKQSVTSEVTDNAASDKHAPIVVTKESLPDEISTPKKVDKQKKRKLSVTSEVTDNAASNKHAPIEVAKESLPDEIQTPKKQVDTQKKRKPSVTSEATDNATSSKHASIDVTKESLPDEIPTPKKQVDKQKKRKPSITSEVTDNATSSKHAPIEFTKESLPDEIPTPKKQLDKQKKRKPSITSEVTDNAASSKHAPIDVANESLPDEIPTPKKQVDKQKKRKPSITSEVTDNAACSKHYPSEVIKESLPDEIPATKKQVDKQKKRKSSVTSEVIDNAASSKYAPIKVTKESLPDEILTPKKQMDKQKKTKSTVATEVSDNASSSQHASIEVTKEILEHKIPTPKKQTKQEKRKRTSHFVSDEVRDNAEVTTDSVHDEKLTPKKRLSKMEKHQKRTSSEGNEVIELNVSTEEVTIDETPTKEDKKGKHKKERKISVSDEVMDMLMDKYLCKDDEEKVTTESSQDEIPKPLTGLNEMEAEEKISILTVPLSNEFSAVTEEITLESSDNQPLDNDSQPNSEIANLSEDYKTENHQVIEKPLILNETPIFLKEMEKQVNITHKVMENDASSKHVSTEAATESSENDNRSLQKSTENYVSQIADSEKQDKSAEESQIKNQQVLDEVLIPSENSSIFNNESLEVTQQNEMETSKSTFSFHFASKEEYHDLTSEQSEPQIQKNETETVIIDKDNKSEPSEVQKENNEAFLVEQKLEEIFCNDDIYLSKTSNNDVVISEEIKEQKVEEKLENIPDNRNELASKGCEKDTLVDEVKMSDKKTNASDVDCILSEWKQTDDCNEFESEENASFVNNSGKESVEVEFINESLNNVVKEVVTNTDYVNNKCNKIDEVVVESKQELSLHEDIYTSNNDVFISDLSIENLNSKMEEENADLSSKSPVHCQNKELSIKNDSTIISGIKNDFEINNEIINDIKNDFDSNNDSNSKSGVEIKNDVGIRNITDLKFDFDFKDDSTPVKSDININKDSIIKDDFAIKSDSIVSETSISNEPCSNLELLLTTAHKSAQNTNLQSDLTITQSALELSSTEAESKRFHDNALSNITAELDSLANSELDVNKPDSLAKESKSISTSKPETDNSNEGFKPVPAPKDSDNVILEAKQTIDSDLTSLKQKPVVPPPKINFKITKSDHKPLKYRYIHNITEELVNSESCINSFKAKEQPSHKEPVRKSDIKPILPKKKIISEFCSAKKTTKLSKYDTTPTESIKHTVIEYKIENTASPALRSIDQNDIFDFEEYIPSQIVCSTKSIAVDIPSSNLNVQTISSDKKVFSKKSVDNTSLKKENLSKTTDYSESVNLYKDLKIKKPDLGKTKHGKANILQQTIIKPASKPMSPILRQPDVFDINSMPIVISDDITPENLVNIPDIKNTSNVTLPSVDTKKSQPAPLKRIYVKPSKPTEQTNFSLVQKVIEQPKSSKYTLPQMKTKIISRTPSSMAMASTSEDSRVRIVTNQHSSKSRILVTPQSQKMDGYKEKSSVKQKPKILSRQVNLVPPKKAALNTFSPVNRLVGKSETISEVGHTIQMQPKTNKFINKNVQSTKTKKLQQQRDDVLLERQVAQKLEAIRDSYSMDMKTNEIAGKHGKKVSHTVNTSAPSKPAKVKPSVPVEPPAPPSTQLNEIVIQDELGNQTTIREGQILALPSDTIKGSYMLVTLDDKGNLTPLNNEALMSLDPNLEGGEISNIILQTEQGNQESFSEQYQIKKSNTGEEKTNTGNEFEVSVANVEVESESQKIQSEKFIASMTKKAEAILSEGNSIILDNDGNQVIIDTSSDGNQIIIDNNDDLIETSDVSDTLYLDSTKNKDILAAALANTDVFPQNKSPPQPSPSEILYSLNYGNVLETSLTLNSPIMSPIEVPSTNVKKVIQDDTEFLTNVHNIDELPITITDPNISQTVSQKHSLVSQDFQNALDATVEISTDIVSSTIECPLNMLNISQTQFNHNMPLLTEEECEISTVSDLNEKSQIFEQPTTTERKEEGLCTLGGAMCSSLSEPPPEMFELQLNKDDIESDFDAKSNSMSNEDNMYFNSPNDTHGEDSCEIPVQPQIVAEI